MKSSSAITDSSSWIFKIRLQISDQHPKWTLWTKFGKIPLTYENLACHIRIFETWLQICDQQQKTLYTKNPFNFWRSWSLAVFLRLEKNDTCYVNTMQLDVKKSLIFSLYIFIIFTIFYPFLRLGKNGEVIAKDKHGIPYQEANILRIHSHIKKISKMLSKLLLVRIIIFFPQSCKQHVALC